MKLLVWYTSLAVVLASLAPSALAAASSQDEEQHPSFRRRVVRGALEKSVRVVCCMDER